MTGTALRSTALAVLLCALIAVSSLGGTQFSTAAFTSQSTNAVSTAGAAADWTPPTVSVVAPSGPLKGAATVSVAAADGETGIASVVLQMQPAGGSTWTTLCTLAAAPYSCTWQTTTVADGAYDLRAMATDSAGYSATSGLVRVNVANAFAVILTDPGEVLRGTVPLRASLQNASPLGLLYAVRLEYSAAGAAKWTSIGSCANLLGSDQCTVNWSTTAVSSGDYDIRAVAYPVLNLTNIVYSVVYSDITVDNVAPVVSMIDPGATLSGTVTLAATASDAHSGVASVAIQYQPATGGSWVTACTVTAAPYSCRYSTLAMARGAYSFRAVATDVAGGTATSSAIANRTVDNTISSVSLDDPGSYLSGASTLTANANSTAGVTSVTIQYAPTGTTDWKTACTTSAEAFTCVWNTAGVADGSYDLRALLVDGSGRTTISASLTSRRVDNTPVRGLDIQAVNGTGTPGRLDAGDAITYTYSRQMNPASILAGFTGAATPVTLRLRDGGLVGTGSAGDTVDVLSSAGTGPISLGTVNLRGDYIKTNKTTLYSATMTATTATVNGASVTTIRISVNSLTSGGALRTASTAGAMIWTPSANATDLAGVRSTTAPITESGALDREF
ncbi:signal peptidase I [Microbacterium esteraromaticum]|uniref:Signal peptidase I n=1 Tax=Microbacterium esteraromaticum TaxID=57043 RepID=A0A7D8A7N2_9MICO|nr:Ig-like domain-containing protein [Microbacterium esteraromaticum]QMU96640.1 signal peptidase I [Microbacterium esteraromaticum]